MPKTVTASEAKNRLGAVLSWVQANQDEVIIENRGEPAVVIMSYTEYERVKQLKEEQRRKDALQRLRALREEVRSRNQDIATDEQAMQVAEQFSRDLVDDLAKKGKVSFEQE
jgi:prevent-host-death family protein